MVSDSKEDDEHEDEHDDEHEEDNDRLLRRGHDDEKDDDDDDGDLRQKIRDHIKRAYVKYTVTHEIKIRKQFEIISNVAADLYCNVALMGTAPPGTMSCSPAYTAGGLQWEPGMAKEDKASRAKAMGAKEVGDKKAGSGKTNVSVSILSLRVCLITW